MPSRRKRNSSKRRQAARRPNTSGPQAAMSVPRSFSFAATTGFPKKLRFRHKFSYMTSISSSSSAVGTLQLSCNSIWDPQQSIFGGQPLYFDQLSAIYDHYTCFKSHMTLRLMNIETYPAVVVLYIEDDTNVADTLQRSAEQPTAVHVDLPGLQGQAKQVVLRRTWDAKSAFGGDIYDNDNLQGSGSSNPLEQQFFTIVVSGMPTDTDQNIPSRVSIDVDIVYDVVWDELKTMVRS